MPESNRYKVTLFALEFNNSFHISTIWKKTYMLQDQNSKTKTKIKIISTRPRPRPALV